MERIIYTNDYCETHSDEEIARTISNHYEDFGEFITEDAANEIIDDNLSIWWEDELSELENFFAHTSEYNYFLTVGTVGRWNGTFAGGDIFRHDEFKKTLYSMLKDCDEVTIKDVDGILNISGIHHDGRISFDIKGITDRGCAYYDRWSENWSDKRTEQEVHEKMWNDSHYTHVLHFADKVYGKITKHKQKKSVPVMA